MRFDCVCSRPAVSTIATSRARAFVERDRGGIGAARRAHEVGAGALCPDLELLLRRRAKRVGGTDEHGAAMLRQLAGELADRRRLPCAIDADHEDHARLRSERKRRRVAEERRDLLDQRLLEVTGDAARLQPPHELRGGGNADVAANERLLEPLPGFVVGRVEGGGRELGGERLSALRERLAHPAEEPDLLRLVGGRDLVAEELGPRVAHAVAARGCWCCGRRRETTCETPSGPIVTP
jgi:hypothetical protein